jgi:hypothetical protein
MFLFDANVHDSTMVNSVRKVKFFYQTHFYLITNNGAKKMIKHLDQIKYQIDCQMSILAIANKLNIYAFDPKNKMSMQNNELPTTIQNFNCKHCSTKREIREIKHAIRSKMNPDKCIEPFNNDKEPCNFKLLIVIIVIVYLLYIMKL